MLSLHPTSLYIRLSLHSTALHLCSLRSVHVELFAKEVRHSVWEVGGWSNGLED